MEKIKIEVIKPGTPVKLVSDPEIKTKIRDARVDVFIDEETNEPVHLIEYGLEHALNKVYPASAFTEHTEKPSKVIKDDKTVSG